MDIYDQILENLELERELGTRTVEIDRALLLPPKPESASAEPAADKSASKPETPTPQPAAISPQPAVPSPQPVVATPVASTPSAPSPAAPNSSGGCDIAFLTGRPLSPAGAEAMAKTFAAMKRIKPDIQVALNESRKSRVIVLLGSDALKKLLPTARPVRGQWIQINGVPAMMTFSPDYIFSHFQAGSPHERQAKSEMWEDIKSALARLHV